MGINEIVTQEKWEELLARVTRLEQALGLAPLSPRVGGEPSPLEVNKEKEQAAEEAVSFSKEGNLPQTWGDRGISLLAHFSESSEWAVALTQAVSLLGLLDTENLEAWLTHYPMLFAEAWKTLEQTSAPATPEEYQAADLLMEVRSELEQQLASWSVEWIVPYPGQTPNADCEWVGKEDAPTPAGTVARCVRRGIRKHGEQILPAQVLQSTGQGTEGEKGRKGERENNPDTQHLTPRAALSIENPKSKIENPSTESFLPELGAAFDPETMEIVGTRRTAYVHENNTVSRVEAAGQMQNGQVVFKAQVMIYRMGDGQ